MKLKLLLAAALAFVFVSCGGTGGNSAEKKKAAATSFGAISAFGPSIFSAIQTARKSLSTQAVETVALTCTPGSGTASVDDVASSITITSASGCTNDGTTIRTGASGLSLTFGGSGTESNFTLSLTFNGSVTITTNGVAQTIVYNAFAMTITATGSGESATGTVRITGSVTVDGQTQTFNDTFNISEL